MYIRATVMAGQTTVTHSTVPNHIVQYVPTMLYNILYYYIILYSN